MLALLIIFIVSFVLLGTIFGVRFYEIQTGKVIISSSITHTSDNFLILLGKKIKEGYKILSFLVGIWSRSLPKRFTKFTHMLWEKGSGRIDRFFYRILHRRK